MRRVSFVCVLASVHIHAHTCAHVRCQHAWFALAARLLSLFSENAISPADDMLLLVCFEKGAVRMEKEEVS